MSPYILFDRQQMERTKHLCGLVTEAQELYRDVLLERGDGEVAKDLSWTQETIEQVIKENYPNAEARMISKYNNSINIISSYNDLIGKFEERETVCKISKKTDISERTIKKHLRLYGLIPQKEPIGEWNKRRSQQEPYYRLGTSYNREQVVVIISSRYDDYLDWGFNQDIVEKALHVIIREWKNEWVGKRVPSRSTVVKIWRKVGIQLRMEKLPLLQQILEENNLLETS